MISNRLFVIFPLLAIVLALVAATPTSVRYYTYEYEEVPSQSTIPPSTQPRAAPVTQAPPPPPTSPLPPAAPLPTTPEPQEPTTPLDGPGSSVTLSDGTTVSSTGDTSVSAAGSSTEGAASANTEEGSVLALGGPGLGLGLAGIFDGFTGMAAVGTPTA